MSTLGFAPPSARRNLVPVRSLLTELREGDIVSAEFYTKAYGWFTITGPVRHTLSPTAWVLGSWYLTQGEAGEPAKQLMGLVRVADRVDGAVVPGVSLDELGQTD